LFRNEDDAAGETGQVFETCLKLARKRKRSAACVLRPGYEFEAEDRPARGGVEAAKLSFEIPC